MKELADEITGAGWLSGLIVIEKSGLYAEGEYVASPAKRTLITTVPAVVAVTAQVDASIAASAAVEPVPRAQVRAPTPLFAVAV